MHFNVDTSSTNLTIIVRYFKRQYISLLLRLLSFLINWMQFSTSALNGEPSSAYNTIENGND